MLLTVKLTVILSDIDVNIDDDVFGNTVDVGVQSIHS